MRFRAMVSLISTSSCFFPGRNLMFVSMSDADDDGEDANSISGEEEEEEEGRVLVLLRLFSLMRIMLVLESACWCGARNACECRMTLLERNINIFKSA